jgi:hypothetical protein
MSVQHATIPPGESFFHPVCLLKDENRFLFTTEGLHRIRACYIRPPTVKIREHPNEENSQRTVVPGTGFKLYSNWVDFIVQPVGRGRPHFVDQNKCNTLITVFGCKKSFTEIEANLYKFHDYKHEQEKLIVYNAIGPKIIGICVKAKNPDPQDIAEAKSVLVYAQRVGVGVEMWEWIVKRLESLPLDHLGKERFDVKNGFYF